MTRFYDDVDRAQWDEEKISLLEAWRVLIEEEEELETRLHEIERARHLLKEEAKVYKLNLDEV